MLLGTLVAGALMGSGSGLERVMSGVGLAGGALQQRQTVENELAELKRRNAEAARQRQRREYGDRLADYFGKIPGSEDIGAMMRIDPEAGLRAYSEQRTAQQEAAQREQAAQILESQGRTVEAQLLRAGGKLGTIDLSGPKQTEYGTALNAFEKPDGGWVQGFMGKDGTVKYVDLPGPPVTQSVAHQSDLAEGKAAGSQLGEGRVKTLETLGGHLAAVSSARAETEDLLRRFEAGEFQGATGPLLGRLGLLWNPETALVQAASVNQAMQQLKTVNLAPVSNEEIRLMVQMGPSPDYTAPQNIAILKRLTKIQAAKEQALRTALTRINTEGYEAYLANPVEIKLPGEQAPAAKGSGWQVEEIK
jgi:hypothetical protein